MKSNIIPIIIILISVAVIGGCAVRYVLYKPKEVQYIFFHEKEMDTDVNATKYVLDEARPPKTEDNIEAKKTEAQDTSELERIVEELSIQADKSNIADP